MIITGHQPNFLPGMSVMEKIRQADRVIWLDQVQFTSGGFTNRNRISEAWMTVPVDRRDLFAPINRVRIADHTFRARRKIARTLEQEIGSAAARYVAELERPYGLLVGLNHALIQLLLNDMGITVAQHYQSHLDTGHPVPAVGDDPSQLVPARDRLAAMVAELGGTVWLSGPSGRGYLDELPFAERGIEVRYLAWDGPNPSAISSVAAVAA